MVLKFFDVVLKFELPRARCVNFPKSSALVLIRLGLIIGDCVYTKLKSYDKKNIYLYFIPNIFLTTLKMNKHPILYVIRRSSATHMKACAYIVADHIQS